jgi:hypothetical protein
MLSTTLNDILKFEPCGQKINDPLKGYLKLLNYLEKTEADDEILPLGTILKSNGLSDAVWSLCTIKEYNREIRLYACWCANECLNYYEKGQSNKLILQKTLLTSIDYANNMKTKDELLSAFDKSRKISLNIEYSDYLSFMATWAVTWTAVKNKVPYIAWMANKALIHISYYIEKNDLIIKASDEFIKLCKDKHNYKIK